MFLTQTSCSPIAFLTFSFALFNLWISSNAEPWTLTNDQRRQYLRHYAPLLFKRGDESADSRGYDWVTNFDFDNDQRFANNKQNWEDLNSFIDGSSHSDWQIRPTMYTAMLEYMAEDNVTKEATLLYHVYHAKQDRSIHDWERIEVRVENIVGDPGTGEIVPYVVITEHSEDKIRERGDSDLNFMTTSMGSHPMIWQAEQRKERNFFGALTGFYGGELHFVEDTFERVSSRADRDDTGEVEVNGDSKKKNVHYVFVPRDDDEARSYWNSQTLTQDNAMDLQHGKDTDGVDFSEVKRINYELQDMADIFPTHWSEGRYADHWTTSSMREVFLEERLNGGIDGGPDVPEGLQVFYTESLDDEDEKEDRNGYPTKSWFWGYYTQSGGTDAAFDSDARIRANGDEQSRSERYFRQHDFFSNDGDGGGRWLPKGWNLEQNGGFDGRWVQMF